MSKFTQLLCVLFTFVSLFLNATGSRPHPALHASTPENSRTPWCDSIKFKIKDCSPYLRKHSSMAEAATSCCLGLMDAWEDNDSSCSDQVFKSIVNLRHVNKTRLTHLSSTCQFSDTSLDDYFEESFGNQARWDKAKADEAKEDQAEADQAKEGKVTIGEVLLVVGIAIALILGLCLIDYLTQNHAS